MAEAGVVDSNAAFAFRCLAAAITAATSAIAEASVQELSRTSKTF